MREHFWLKIAITLAAFGVIFLRILWPNIKLDAISLGLVIVAILPWLSAIIESAKFPGGWEIKFREVHDAGQKVIGSSSGRFEIAERPRPAYLDLTRKDPNLALAGLRIEIERRLRMLAERHGVVESGSLLGLFRRLRDQGVLNEDSVDGLQDLVMAGNSAVHGARVEEAVADWAFEYGPQVLAVLDDRLVTGPAA